MTALYKPITLIHLGLFSELCYMSNSVTLEIITEISRIVRAVAK